MAQSVWYDLSNFSQSTLSFLPSLTVAAGDPFKYNNRWYYPGYQIGSYGSYKVYRDDGTAVYTVTLVNGGRQYPSPYCVFAKGYLWAIGYNSSSGKLTLDKINPNGWVKASSVDLSSASYQDQFVCGAICSDGDNTLYMTYQSRGTSATAYVDKYVMSTSSLENLGNLPGVTGIQGIGVSGTRVYLGLAGLGIWHACYIPKAGGTVTSYLTANVYIGAGGFGVVTNDSSIISPDAAKKWVPFDADLYTVAGLLLYRWSSYPMQVFVLRDRKIYGGIYLFSMELNEDGSCTPIDLKELAMGTQTVTYLPRHYGGYSSNPNMKEEVRVGVNLNFYSRVGISRPSAWEVT